MVNSSSNIIEASTMVGEKVKIITKVGKAYLLPHEISE